VDLVSLGRRGIETAAREDKPSSSRIGYATCHWCHVMERESFRRRGAALLNEHFVRVKVDARSAPTSTSVYMTRGPGLTGTAAGRMYVSSRPTDGRSSAHLPPDEAAAAAG
jgi:uncharacterized protein YyaL (SSP411 family)